jgi:hypothetical protein
MAKASPEAIFRTVNLEGKVRIEFCERGTDN